VVPHEGFWKTFNNDAYDFFTARGYISFNATKHINFQFGHDQHFWGNGYRSLMLSDFSPAFLFLKINTRVWRINYTNLFTQMKADAFANPGGGLQGSVKFPNKFVTMHHLSINITDNFNLGLFEAVIFGREDSTAGAKFELSYLNPIIFYRAIEQSNGSIDNAIIGIDILWNFAHKLSLYGQLMIDELKVNEATSGDGWWGNKFGWQLGVKYIDAFKIPNLDLQLEYNSIRPYIYQHETEFTNYAHYRQALAHPLGANLRELVGIVRYQPLKKLSLSTKIIISNYGEDSISTNYGKDIMKDDRTHEMDFDNEIAQGINTNLSYFDFTASFMFRHNLFFDATMIYRNLESDLASLNTDNAFISLSLRLNIRKRLHEF